MHRVVKEDGDPINSFPSLTGHAGMVERQSEIYLDYRAALEMIRAHLSPTPGAVTEGPPRSAMTNACDGSCVACWEGRVNADWLPTPPGTSQSFNVTYTMELFSLPNASSSLRYHVHYDIPRQCTTHAFPIEPTLRTVPRSSSQAIISHAPLASCGGHCHAGEQRAHRYDTPHAIVVFLKLVDD
ncbi:hypothetical protein BDW22DRAFT_1348419 [Trametopsis cervina]|nr:hypothetical protein BDW22DRAFT_1348419 [Trametopsis cervina]